MQVIQAENLKEIAQNILQAAGAPEDIATNVAHSLVESNLYGHDSHGVILLIKYVSKIRSQDLIPTARPEIGERNGSTATVNSNWGFGHISACFGVDLACEIASELGMSCVALTKVNHIGRLGDYAGRIAERGLIGLVLTTGSMLGGQVAPYGGRERRFGTNPIAWGIPIADGKTPLISDFATSAYSAGKVGVYERKGETLPEGIIIDPEGNPSVTPSDFPAGGALLPFGGYKGYGLSLIIEIIVSTLSGFAPASSNQFQQGNPTLIMAIQIDRFTSKARFQELVEEVLHNVKVTEPAPGFDEVMLPGEVEQRSHEARTKDGIPVSDATWSQLKSLADSLGVDMI